MNDSDKHSNGDKDLTKDQLAEEGLEVDYSSSAAMRQSNKYREDLAEEAKWPKESRQQDVSLESTAASETRAQEEDNGYYSGMSQ